MNRVFCFGGKVILFVSIKIGYPFINSMKEFIIIDVREDIYSFKMFFEFEDLFKCCLSFNDSLIIITSFSLMVFTGMLSSSDQNLW